ncbi:MAG: HAD family hydrolase [Ignavibacteria bacterium]|nr:HAD family hydrolase [Ignavibacteria bacterium]
MKKAIFLDRDGTINHDVGYLSKKKDIKILQGAHEALSVFKSLGYLNIVVTNQSGIARGYYTEEDLKDIHDEFLNLLNSDNRVLIDDIFYSPYHTEGIVKKYTMESNTRKPGTGMIMLAVEKYEIDLNQSFLIGDSLVDMQCARNAGIKKILVMTGYGDITIEKCKSENIHIEFIAADLKSAAEFIGKMQI